MAITKLTTDVEIITALSDSPSLTNNELKAKFDEAGNLIQTYYNEVLTSEVDALLSGLDTSKRNTADVYKLIYDRSVLGTITDGSTKSITGISDYNILIAESTADSLLLFLNNSKTKLFGINKWSLSFNDDYYMAINTIFGTISDENVTFNIKNQYHIASLNHGTLDTYGIRNIYGLI